MFNIRRFFNGLQIIPKTSSAVDTAGEMDFDTSTHKLNLHNGTTSSPVVTETHADQGANRLQNKDLSADNIKVVDASDTTKKFGWSLSGATTGKTTTLATSSTVNRTLTLPDATDTLTANAATQTLTNKTIDATGNTITNLVNSNLSGSAAITNANLATMTTGTVKGNISGSTATPSDVAATSANTNSTVVLRDSSGNFSAGTITASLTGNASGTAANVTGTVTPDHGGTGVANNSASTLTISGNFGTTLTVSGTTSVTLPTSGTLATKAGVETLTNKTINTNANTIQSGAATNQQVLTADGSGGTSWATQLSNWDSSFKFANLGLNTSVASNAMTIALKQSDGSTDATVGSPVVIAFRSATNTSGAYVVRSITAALSIVLPTGATLGLPNSTALIYPFYLYALDNAGTVELAVCGTRINDEGVTASTTTIGGSSTSGTTLYSTTGRSNVAIRYLGRIGVAETTAGTYASNASYVTIDAGQFRTVGNNEVYVNTGSGHGSTNTKIRTYSNNVKAVGTAITYQSSATAGDTFTINETGVYAMSRVDVVSTTTAPFGMTVNSAQLTTAISSSTAANVIIVGENDASNTPAAVSVTLNLNAGDVIRAHDDTSVMNGTTFYNSSFRICRIA